MTTNIVSIMTSKGIQQISLSSSSGDSGTWTQARPIAQKPARVMKLANGKWEWKAVTNVIQSGRASVRITGHELRLYQGDGGYFSLGYHQYPRLPLKTYQYGYAAKSEASSPLKPRQLLRSQQIKMPRSNCVWTFCRSVDYSSAWIGPFVKVGGTAAVVGAETGYGVIFNINDRSQKYFVTVETTRCGPGLGGTAGVALGIFTGFKSADQIRRHEETGWDFSLAIASKWDAYAKFAGKAKLHSVATSLTNFGDQMKDVKSAKPLLMSAANSMSEVGDLYKVAQTGSASIDDNKPHISLFDIPTGSVGLEAAVYKTVTKVGLLERM